MLHKHVWDKSKVHVGKRVRSVVYENGRPVVVSEDGSKYHGDIVVGCDGVHSAVRREMWRICDEETPGKIPEKDKTCQSHSYHLLRLANGTNSFDIGVQRYILGR